MLYSAKCAIALYLRIDIHTLILRHFIAKKNASHHLSLHQVTTFLLVEGLASMLMALNDQGGGAEG